MTYENFQNLGEAKNQETGKGEREGGLESPECALTMSTRVSAVVSHHAPGRPLPLPEPLTLHVEGPGRRRDSKSDLEGHDFLCCVGRDQKCAWWVVGFGEVHPFLTQSCKG